MKYKKFFEQMKDIQEKMGYNFSDFGRYLGVGNHIVGKWIKGVRNPSNSTIKLMNVLHYLYTTHPEIHKKFEVDNGFYIETSVEKILNKNIDNV